MTANDLIKERLGGLSESCADGKHKITIAWSDAGMKSKSGRKDVVRGSAAHRKLLDKLHDDGAFIRHSTDCPSCGERGLGTSSFDDEVEEELKGRWPSVGDKVSHKKHGEGKITNIKSWHSSRFAPDDEVEVQYKSGKKTHSSGKVGSNGPVYRGHVWDINDEGE